MCSAPYLWMIEATSAHLSRAIAEAKRRRATVCEIRQEAHDEYFQKCLKRREKNFLFTPTCAGSNTYYLDNKGDSPFRPSTHAKCTGRTAITTSTSTATA